MRLFDRSSVRRAVCAAGYGVVLLAAQSLPFSAVRAQSWQVTAGVAVREEFTDNVGLATQGQDRHSELTTTITPSISIRRAEGGRVSLDLDFSLGSSFQKDNDSQGTDFQNTLSAKGRAEIWDRIVFLDASASISRQVTDNRNASSASQAGQQINRTEVRNVNLSPSFLHHFGTWVETITRFTFSKVMSDGSEADTFTNEQHIAVSSGRRFSRLLWNFSINDRKTSRSDGTPSDESFRSNVDFTYVVSPKLSILFGGGFERIDDGTLTDNPVGPTWDVGVNLRPGRRTSLRATFGKRFDSDVVTVDASHQLSSRTSVSVTLSETIQTSQQAIAQDTSFIGTDAQGNLIDTRTGLPFVAGTGAFGFSTNAFRQKRFSAQISGSRRRNSFTGRISWESRKTDATGIEEIVLSGNLNLTRRLWRRLTGRLGVNYSQTDFGTADSRFAKELTVSTGLDYRILESVSGSLNYIHTRREDNVGRAGFHENAVSIGLNKTF